MHVRHEQVGSFYLNATPESLPAKAATTSISSAFSSYLSWSAAHHNLHELSA